MPVKLNLRLFLIKRKIMKIGKGQKAPDFTLYNQNKEEVNLSNYKGENVILLFFPLAFTSTCTKEMCATRDIMSDYEKLHAKVFGISVDSTFTLAKYQKEHDLNFPLLSDFNREVSPQYAGFYEKFVMGMKEVSKRAVFVIDKEGMVQHVEILDSPGDMPDLDAIKLSLKNLN